ncbi:MAG TPA: transcription-repair coupling factor [Anaeromyxobacteraceae bacterium]|nr:transcription-repair coupling factor [Anaeromyxobacteraceae bacterium]
MATETAPGNPLARIADDIAGRGEAHVSGLSGAARGQVARALVARGRTLLAVAAGEEEAELLARDLSFFLAALAPAGAVPVVRVPADPVLPYDDLSPDRSLEMERLAALCRLHLGSGVRAVVVSARALARRMVPRSLLERHADLVGPGLELPRDALAARLAELGYARVPLVEDPGTFAVRGGIVDLWSPLDARPVRLEYFGDAIESARAFDPEGQLTVGDAGELVLCPAREILFTPGAREAARSAVRELAEQVARPTGEVRELLEKIDAGAPFFGMEALLPAFHQGGLATLFDHLPAGSLAFVDDPAGVDQALADLEEELRREHGSALARAEIAMPPGAHYLPAAATREALGRLPRVFSHRVYVGTGEPVRFDHGDTAGLRAEIEGAHGEEGALAPLTRRLDDWRRRGLAAVIACSTPSSADRLRRLLEDRRAPARSHPGPLPADPRSLYDPAVHAHLLPGEISAGFVDGHGKLALLSDGEIFGRRVKRRARQARAENAFAAAFRELDEGDLVVHVEHGIARYLGLTKMQIRGAEGDFLVLAYAGADRLYLPVSKLRQVQKFSGAAPENVRLDRLGGSSFALRKARVKEQLLQMAAELLDVYAARAAHPGHAFAAPDEAFREFEAEFPWEPTPDQQKAIDDVLGDLRKEAQRPPMDRLVCGDVGYGKTEVAMRAAMLAVLSRKQVAVLVPTTVLAAQHERTFRERFRGYPVRIEALSRMKSADEVRAALRDLAAGKVDVVIGTHRLLGADVAFKDLGLVVVDEEQRFGVAHKERLKKLRRLVDVLTLTATPIPRTLHMSLSGVRDLSIIATPPEDRRAIRTFVVKFDPPAIQEAIRQELRRGGQVFFVHNRVRSIGGMEKFLRELVPEARIGVAHGQMAEGKLEDVMTRFVTRELDLLLATSIIESGLDIPSANTVIVNRADHFGLAQLYQIRGRVGRSRERAYAWLLVPARRPVTPEAVKRLEALQRFSELGAGFQIASHDLDIRGAGNLLGRDQSGHVEAVGFDLYTQMLEEAIRERKGEPPREEIDPDVQLPLPAWIPDAYVPDVHQRLWFYKRFAQASGEEELDEIRAEILDRYGDAPPELDALCALMALKVGLRALAIRALEAGPGRLVFTLGEGAALDAAALARWVERSGGALRLTPDMKLVVHLGEGGRPAPPGRAPRPRPGPPPSPAQEAAAGMELLAAARAVLADLAARARDGRSP